MIKPRDGYIVATKNKDDSKGFVTDVPGYKDEATGKIIYTPSIYQVISQSGTDYYIIDESTVSADEVTNE